MARVACPHCYEMIDNSRLAFQCRGVGAPGRRGCEPIEDERRARTGYVGRSLPVFLPESRWVRATAKVPCPWCGGLTGVRACPKCHTPLPTTFVGSRSPLIGMVGGVGAGKTVYLTVLRHLLETTVRKRFDADIRLAGDQQDSERSTKEFLDRYERALFEDGRLFPPTSESGGRKQPIVLEWRQPWTSWLGRESHRTTMLSFYDTAGEDQTTQARVHDQRYLGAASGIIVLLDPWQIPEIRDQLHTTDAVVRTERPAEVLRRVVELLRAEGVVRPEASITVPVAVVFAKIDALADLLGPDDPLFAPSIETIGYDDADGARVHEYVVGLLHRFGADDIDQVMRKHFTTFRYFAVSALGAEPDYQQLEVDPGGVQPLRVEEPLLWLLHRLQVIRGTRE